MRDGFCQGFDEAIKYLDADFHQPHADCGAPMAQGGQRRTAIAKT
jgi:hypothetical protein